MFVQRMVKDPEFASRVFEQQAKQDAADAYLNGYGPEQEAASISCLEEETPSAQIEEHARLEEIRVIAQSLAFVGAGRGATGFATTQVDARELEVLLREAYSDEVEGRAEGFRRGEMITAELVQEMLDDASFRWVLVEVANGRDVEQDGAVLGVACYSMAPARTFPQRGGEEGCNAALRFLAVRRRYRGLCVGDRLLERVKLLAHRGGASQLLACVPSPRQTLQGWLQKRGFKKAATSDFPTATLPFKITKPDAHILIFATQLGGPTSELRAAVKAAGASHTPTLPGHAPGVITEVEQPEDEEYEDMD